MSSIYLEAIGGILVIAAALIAWSILPFLPELIRDKLINNNKGGSTRTRRIIGLSLLTIILGGMWAAIYSMTGPDWITIGVGILFLIIIVGDAVIVAMRKGD